MTNNAGALTAPVAAAAGAPAAPSPGTANEALYQLFAQVVERHTGGATSVVDEATAYRLLESLRFVLGGIEDEPAVPGALEGAFETRCRELTATMDACADLWRRIRIAMPPDLRNVSLRDTLASIDGCWARYDPRTFAQEVAADIDYQLCMPPASGLEGPPYLADYLRRLLIEAHLLERFDATCTAVLLAASCPDWRGLHVNLYEPVAACALGRALLGKDPARLAMTPADQDRLANLVRAGGHAARMQALDAASAQVAAALGLETDEHAYLQECARSLEARLAVGGARGVFVAF